MAEIIIGFSGDPRYIRRLPFSLFESETFEAGMVKEIPGAGTITLQPMSVTKFATDSQTTQQLLEVAFAVAAVTAPISIIAGVITSYLSDKLKAHDGPKTTIIIHNRVNHFYYHGDTKDVEALKKALEKALREKNEDE